jgi:hypothetical protein
VMLRARWVTLRARWVMLRARWVTLRARWVTLRARWVTLRYVVLPLTVGPVRLLPALLSASLPASASAAGTSSYSPVAYWSAIQDDQEKRRACIGSSLHSLPLSLHPAPGVVLAGAAPPSALRAASQLQWARRLWVAAEGEEEEEEGGKGGRDSLGRNVSLPLMMTEEAAEVAEISGSTWDAGVVLGAYLARWCGSFHTLTVVYRGAEADVPYRP